MTVPTKITSESLLPKAKKLLDGLNTAFLPPAFVGFDGFIDIIQKAVKKNANGETTYFNTIHDFAEHLDRMNGKSGQVEFVTSQIKMGGNAPILSHALSKLGIKNKCLGAMGFPEVDPMFSFRNQLDNLISISPPGKSNAVEFANGKIIFSDLSVFQKYNWDFIKRRVNFIELRKAVEKSKLIALVDWANLPHATDLWEGFLKDVVIPIGNRDQFFLFDLCDPSKKPGNQIRKVLNLIGQFSRYGKVILGLNENEATVIWTALNQNDKTLAKDVKVPSLDKIGHFIYQKMNVDTLLIHPLDRTLVFRDEKKFKENSFIVLKGQVIKDPKVQTGGGDNLNAGFCLGLLAGFEIQYCMLLGMATSGAYLQNGTSPDINDLIAYIKKWNGEQELDEVYHEPVKYFSGY
jgi:hypothetical protein